MKSPIKKPMAMGLITAADDGLNFKANIETVEAQWDEIIWIEKKYRQRRFNYYFELFDLKDGDLYEPLTEKQEEQYSLIWKLVDLEGGWHE